MAMLSTTDNPYNPRTDYNKWLRWDQEQAYYTQEYLARIVQSIEPNVAEIEDDKAIEEITEFAMNAILDNDVTNTYVLVP